MDTSAGTRRTLDEELGHGDEAKDVDREHRLHVRLRDVAHALDTEHEARVVHCSPRASTASKSVSARCGGATARGRALGAENGHAPRMSMLRRSAGTLSRKDAICFLSETSSGSVTNLPPSLRPDSLCAAAHASATALSASTRRAQRTRFEPPCERWSVHPAVTVPSPHEP